MIVPLLKGSTIYHLCSYCFQALKINSDPTHRMAQVAKAVRKGPRSSQSMANPVLLEIIENGSIDEEMIRNYGQNMSLNYEIMDSEKSWDAITVNLKILDVLLTKNTNLPLLRTFLCTIFKTFRDLNDNVIEKKPQLSNILAYRLQDINATTEIQRRIYLQIKVSLLRLCALDLDSVKSQYKEITENFDHDSVFYRLFTADSNHNIDLAYILSYSLIKLSLSTKTAYKLVFLILATHYSIFTNNARPELFDKIVKDGGQMFMKSETLIYKLTASHLFALTKVCMTNGDYAKSLYGLVDVFNKYQENILQRELSKKNASSKELLQPLEDMNISENFTTLLNTYESDKQFDSRRFMKQLSLIIQNIDVRDNSQYETLGKVIDFLTSSDKKYESMSRLLDMVLLKFKNFKCALDNIDFIFNSLNQISRFLIKINQKKKLNNLARLFFHFGTLASSFDSATSLLMLTSFVQCDHIVNDSISSKIATSKRINYVTNEQMLKANYEVATTIQLIFMNTALVDEHLFLYEQLLKNEYSASVKIISNCIINHIQCCDLVFKHIKDESLITALMLSIISHLEIQNKIQNKAILISQIIVSQKENLNDTGLFLYFLSKISMIIDFPINFKSSTLKFNPDSAIIDIESLVILHLYILQSYSNARYNPGFLLECYDLITVWMKSTEFKYSKYEFDVVTTLYHALQYNGFYSYGLKMVKVFLTKRIEPQAVEDRKRFLSFAIKLLAILDNSTEWEEFIKEYNQDFQVHKIDTIEDLRLSLAVLQYSIKINDISVKKKIQQIYSIFGDDERFSVQKQGDKYKAVELLLLHSDFCLILGLCDNSSHMDAVSNLNRSMGILQSVFKNFLLQTPQTPSLNLNFKSVLKMRFSLGMLSCYNGILEQLSIIGLGKEFDHYLKELEMFVKVQPSNNLQYYFAIILIDFNSFKDAMKEASEYSAYLDLILADTCLEKDELSDIYRLTVMENYNRKIGDLQAVKATSVELDRRTVSYLNSHNISSSFFKLLVTLLWRRFGNEYESKFHNNLLITQKEFDSSLKFQMQLNIFKAIIHLIHTNSIPVSCYPTKDVSSLTGVLNEDARKLKDLNIKLIEHFRNDFENSTVEISKNQLYMIINCFSKMVISDNQIKANKDMTQIVSLLDSFRYNPFMTEKEFALNPKKQKCLLPIIPECRKAVVFSNAPDINLKNVLPPYWQVLTIDYVVSTNSLAIVKYDSRYEDPLFVNISLKGKNKHHSFQETLKSLRSIIEQSDKTTSTEVTANISSYEEKVEWWETRKNLDKKLENLLDQIDTEWFGGYNSLFQPSATSLDEIRAFKSDLIKIFMATVGLKGIDDEVVRKNLMDVHDSMYDMFLKIERISVEKVVDLLHLLVESVFRKYITFDKNEIFEIASALKAKIVASNKKRIICNDSIFHTVLIPGSGCTQIPWESIPSLRHKSVTRMPTLSQLESYLIKYKNLLINGIDACKGYYVINPGGDLKRTESNLSPRFKDLDGWDGLIGKIPSDCDILKAFDEKNLYIYAGHGGGEQYVKSRHIKKRDYIPPSLLLGCSSGSLKGGGSIHQYGTAYNYINGGCPMLLVNLWDVTDKDIDLFTISALTKWGFFVDYNSLDPFDISANNPTISLSVAEARDVCKLKYLNGAAPIVYGLPLCLETI